MPRRNPDWKVGELGVWAYETRLALTRSDKQVAQAVGVSDAYIRKIEGGSARPSAALVRRMFGYFQRLSAEQGVPIDRPPIPAEPEPPGTTGEQGALVDAISRLVEQLQADREDRRTNTWRRIESLEQQIAALRQERLTWERGVQTAIREAIAAGLGQSADREPKPPAIAPQ